MSRAFRHALALVLAPVICAAGLLPPFSAAANTAPLGISIPRTGDISPLLAAQLLGERAMAGAFHDQLATPAQQGLYRQLAALAPVVGAQVLELEPPLTVERFVWESADPDLRHSQVLAAVGEALNPVLAALLADRPEVFWLQERTRFNIEDASAYSVDEAPGGESLTVYRVVMNPRTASSDEGELREMADRLEEAAGHVLGAVEGATRYRRLLALQDILLLRLEQAPARDPSPYKDTAATLVTGAATAGGYARAFQLLCHRLGVPCVVMGSGGDYPTTWCAVQMEDGGWYAVDPYWNSGQEGEGRFLVGSGSFPLAAEPPAHGFSYPALEQGDYGPGEGGGDIVPADTVAASGPLVYGQPLSAVRPVGSFCTAAGGEPVPGLLEWLEPGVIPHAGIYNAAYRFTPDAEGFGQYSGTAPVAVEPRALIVTPGQGSSVYNGGYYPDPPIPYTCAGLVEGDSPQDVLTGMLALDGAEAGARFVVQGTLSANQDYALAVSPAGWTVAPRELAITRAELWDREYDGTRRAEVRGLRMQGIVGADEVIAHAAAEYETPQAGADKRAVVTVTGLSGGGAGNYVLPEATYATTGTVHKYGSPSCQPGRVSVPLAAGENSVYLEMLAQPEGPGDPGELAYPHEPVAEHRRFFSGAPYIRQGYLHYATQSGLAPGQTATVTVAVESGNYAGFDLVIHFTAEDKLAVQGAGVTVASRTYNGLPVQPEGAVSFTCDGVGEVQVSGVVYRYAGVGGTSHGDPLAPPVHAGSYELVVEVAADDPSYTGATAPIPFTIYPAQLELRPRDVEILVGEAPPDTYAILYTGLVGGDGPEVVSPAPVAAADAVDTGAPGTAAIRIVNSPAAADYTLRTAPGTLTVRASTLDSTYLRATAAGEAGWHNKAIRVEPTGKDGFDRIALSAQGPFGASVTIDEEAAEGERLLYLAKGGVVSGGVAFRYRLDRTPPTIQCAYRQIHGRAEGMLTVAATDTLSGVARVTVTGPDGRQVAAAGEGYPVAASGTYTVVVADHAGNTTTLREQVTVRGVERVAIALSAGGSPPALVDGTAPMTLAAEVTGTALGSDYTALWASSNPLVASVDGEGAVTFHSRGRTTLSVQVMGVTATHDLEVALSVPVNGPADGTAPWAEVPAGSVPQGVDPAGLRLVVAPVSDTDRLLLMEGLEANKGRFSGMEVSLMDIRLVDAATGRTVEPAGEVAITLPLPAGADRGGRFVLLHLTGAGAQFPAVTVSATGIRFRVSSLSPFALGHGASAVIGGGQASPGGGTTALDEEEYWALVLEKVRAAAPGTGVAISIGRYSLVPAEVLWAARGRAVTLTFVGAGGNIVLYGMDLPELDRSVNDYTPAQLEKLAADIAAKKTGGAGDADPGMPVYMPPEPVSTVVVSETGSGQAQVYHQVGEGDVAVVNDQAPGVSPQPVRAGADSSRAATPFTIETGYSEAQRGGITPGEAVAFLLIAGAVAMAALVVWPLLRPPKGPGEGGRQEQAPPPPSA